MSTAFEPAALISHARAVHTRTRPAAAVTIPYQQGALALTYPLPNGLPAEPPARRLTLVGDIADPSVPSAELWASKFLQAVVEAVSNDRPIAQLARWTSSRVYADLNARRKRVAAQLNGRHGKVSRHQIATVHVCQISSEVAEVSGRVITGRRSRALAARLEFVHARWTCTELVFG